MVTAITYGSFDVLHKGHLALLKKAKKLFSKIIVGLSTDEFHFKKGKNGLKQNYWDRYRALMKTGLVDMIIPENNWMQKPFDIKKYNVDYLFMGGDWVGRMDGLEFCVGVVYFPRYKGISSTQLRKAEVVKNVKFSQD